MKVNKRVKNNYFVCVHISASLYFFFKNINIVKGASFQEWETRIYSLGTNEPCRKTLKGTILHEFTQITYLKKYSGKNKQNHMRYLLKINGVTTFLNL